MRRKDHTVECNFDPRLTGLLFLMDEQHRAWEGELVITSGSELSAIHGLTSLHYNGCAADLRIWRTHKEPSAQLQLVALRIVADLYCDSIGIPRNWIDIILETNHIHLELQPKRPA